MPMSMKTVSTMHRIILSRLSAIRPAKCWLTDDVSEYQSYTIRRLDQRQSNKPDTDRYKLMDVQEDAISNKFKHLDVLCFPTLFPTGRFGESHPRDNAISVSEFAKSHLINKDSRFRKDDQHVFYLLWQKEMREISAGVLKSTRQHAMPVVHI